MNLFRLVDATPRRTLLLVAVACVCMLGFGLYLQQVVGLEPCPMCIVQRYALVLVALIALFYFVRAALKVEPIRG